MSLPYVGSEIGLISNSDIRFQGILHSINPNDSTVALEQGRKGNPAEEIPAADQVFPYIVFKGTDIKDLYVISGPKAVDPAAGWSQAYNGLPPGMNPYYAQQAMAFHQQQQQQYWQQQQMGYAPVIVDSVAPNVSQEPIAQTNTLVSSAATNVVQAPTPAVKAVPATGPAQPNVQSLSQGLKQLDVSKPKVVGKEIKVTLPHVRETPKSNNKAKDAPDSSANGFALPPKPKTSTNTTTPTEKEIVQKENANRNTRTARAKIAIPDAEFDFATANAKFDKSTVQVTSPTNDAVFYKKSSFFDDISCEVKDRAEGKKFDRKAHQAEEKNQNLETFGTAGVYRGRGRRGRGNYRGRGSRGRGNYNNSQRQDLSRPVVSES